MRIAIISTPFVSVPPERYGGTELVVANLVDGLSAAGHEVVLYATGDSRTSARVRALYPEAVWPPDVTRELTHTAAVIYDLLEAEPFDVIHAHSPPALAFAPLLDTPVLYTIHHERDPILCELYAVTGCKNVTMVAISARQAELVADVCEARVVHHGLDTSLYPLGQGDGGYAAFLGRLAREKGVHHALDVAEAARVPLRVGGQPHWKDQDYFRLEIEPRFSEPEVSWLGEVGHESKLELLRHAAACLMPIEWEEPFGLVMIESMLVGTPVLAFPRGAAPEVVEEGVTGFICPTVHDMAARLYALQRGALPFDREACRRRAVERFSRERMVAEYLQLYEEVLGTPASRGARLQ